MPRRKKEAGGEHSNNGKSPISFAPSMAEACAIHTAWPAVKKLYNRLRIIQNHKLLGAGAFGRVYATSAVGDNGQLEAAVKVVNKPSREDGERIYFRGHRLRVNGAMASQAKAALNELWARDDWDPKSDEFATNVREALKPFRKSRSALQAVIGILGE